ncbi:MarR family transcriptional regulator [Cellulomonas sp.]|uniref:MarR family winged helix-turn-helix transcriptional regulator n=1 Tax=Cellulomonas sp. TaxID=40001 RepID=UPI001B0C0C34|nr:MarR family transcriptional regulator [Cellulomonas sp.]MBO9555937.1 MarR family transcriptional regulator [Cellulomonas sp.]
MSDPTETPHRELLRSLERFGRAVREASYLLAKQYPCTRGSVSVVRMLDRRGTMQVGDIADTLHVDISVASRQVSTLVTEGYVERAVAGDDRRVRTLRLTPAGQELAARLRADTDRRMAELFADWSPADVVACADMLDRLTGTLEMSARTDADERTGELLLT